MAWKEEELRLLAGLPQLIGAAAASVSASGVVGTGREFIAGATALLEGLRSHPGNSIIRDILPDPSADRSRALAWARSSRDWVSSQISVDGRPSRQRLMSATVQAADAVETLLRTKASPTESQEYREWALAIAERVANASSEGGFLGFGGERVTAEERQFIDQLRSVLGLTTGSAQEGQAKLSPERALTADASPARRSLTGRKVLITAGPTQEPLLDGIHMTRSSRAVEGYALAEAAVALGAETVVVSGPVSLPIPPGAQLLMVETADDMLKACERELPCDIAVHAAAEVGWQRENVLLDESPETIPGERFSISLVRSSDILTQIGSRTEKRPPVVVGLLSRNNGKGSAEERLRQTQADLIVAAGETGPGELLFPDRRNIHLHTIEGAVTWNGLSTREFARRLMEDLTARLEVSGR